MADPNRNAVRRDAKAQHKAFSTALANLEKTQPEHEAVRLWAKLKKSGDNRQKRGFITSWYQAKDWTFTSTWKQESSMFCTSSKRT